MLHIFDYVDLTSGESKNLNKILARKVKKQHSLINNTVVPLGKALNPSCSCHRSDYGCYWAVSRCQCV